MKKILLFIIGLTSLTLSSCEYAGFICAIFNCTDEKITILWGYKDARNDTTIIIDEKTGGLSPAMVNYATIDPNDYYTDNFIGGVDTPEYCNNFIQKEYHGLLRMFVVRTEDVVKYGWKHVVENDMVLQRYDLTDADMKTIGKYVYFPPTPDMMNISMWPLYGTYPSGYPKENPEKIHISSYLQK